MLNETRCRTAVKSVFKRLNISTNQAAKVSGLGESGLRSFLNGTSRGLNIETYEKLSVGLGVSVTDILGIESSSPTSLTNVQLPTSIKTIPEINVRGGRGFRAVRRGQHRSKET